MVAHRVTLIPGDGIGPEVIEAARRVVEATGVSIEWERRAMGAGAFSRTGRALPLETLDSIRTNRVALKGPIETPITSGLRSSNLELRKSLDLYANVRPCRLYPGVPSVYDTVDLVIVRENTEGMYTGLEFEMGTVAVKELIGFVEDSTGRRIREDSGVSIKSISERGSERVVRFAFEEARRRGRSRVTASHKANIMKCSDGLFLEVARRVAGEFPDVAFDDRIIDALCMQLIQAPERFEVLVMPNLYGDVAAELGAGLIGGTGVAPGGHFGGVGGLELAVFEATHGTAPKYAGLDKVNPGSLILSGAAMFEYIGWDDAKAAIQRGMESTIRDKIVTYDLARQMDGATEVSCSAFAEAIVERL